MANFYGSISSQSPLLTLFSHSDLLSFGHQEMRSNSPCRWTAHLFCADLVNFCITIHTYVVLMSISKQDHHMHDRTCLLKTRPNLPAVSSFSGISMQNDYKIQFWIIEIMFCSAMSGTTTKIPTYVCKWGHNLFYKRVCSSWVATFLQTSLWPLCCKRPLRQ